MPLQVCADKYTVLVLLLCNVVRPSLAASPLVKKNYKCEFIPGISFQSKCCFFSDHNTAFSFGLTWCDLGCLLQAGALQQQAAVMSVLVRVMFMAGL